jgi:hypothetical protein
VAGAAFGHLERLLLIQAMSSWAFRWSDRVLARAASLSRVARLSISSAERAMAFSVAATSWARVATFD